MPDDSASRSKRVYTGLNGQRLVHELFGLENGRKHSRDQPDIEDLGARCIGEVKTFKKNNRVCLLWGRWTVTTGLPDE